MTTRSLILAAAVIAAAAAFASRQPAAGAPQKPPKPALQKFMRAKLDAANQVLEGLTTEDFKLIAAGAKKLREMSAAEQWRVSNDAMYRQHSAEFQRITGQLETAAEKKDVNSAALTWIEATMSCIECHKHVRTLLIAQP
jgi:hypothetical protein